MIEMKKHLWLFSFFVIVASSCVNAEEQDKEEVKSTNDESSEYLSEVLDNMCTCFAEHLTLKGDGVLGYCLDHEGVDIDLLDMNEFGDQLKKHLLRDCPGVIENLNAKMNELPWVKNIISQMSLPNCDSIKDLNYLEFDYFTNSENPDSIQFLDNSDKWRSETIRIDDCNFKMVFKEVFENTDAYQVGDTITRKYVGQYKNYVLIEDVMFNGAKTQTLYKIVSN